MKGLKNFMANPFKKLRRNMIISGKETKNYLEMKKSALKVTWENLRNVFNKQGGRCFWYRIKLDPMDIFITEHPLAMSVDRLDNSKYYELDNIVICCRMTNLGRRKCNAKTFREIINTRIRGKIK